MLVYPRTWARYILCLLPLAANPSQILGNNSPQVAPTREQAIPPKRGDSWNGTHRFWDKRNCWLFAGVGAARTLDYFSTLNMRRRGRQEIVFTNDLVDNHAAFAVVEAAGTGVSIGASYLFHRYGHHRLERWTSIVHLSVTLAGAARNYSLKTAHAPLITTQP